MLRKLLFIALLLSFVGPVHGDDWPQFLGKNRDGKSDEKGLISEWPKDGLKEKWRRNLGEGMSGIAIANGKLLTMFQDEKSQYVICLNAKTGMPLWKKVVGENYQNSMGHGPRATPTVSGETVFAFTGDGDLASLKLADGEINWLVKTSERNGKKPAEYGMSSSPLLVGDEVIVNTNPGKDGFTVSAYAIKDGEFRWGTNREAAGYSSPALLKVAGEDHIVVFCGKSLFGVQPVTGRMIWQFPFVTEYNCNSSSPIAVGKNLFISSGENHGSVLLGVKKDGDRYKVNTEWSSLGRESVLRSEWQTPILHKGYVYGFDNVGSASAITHLTCIEASSGKRVWQKLRFGKGNLIFADGKLIISTMKGELILVKATSDEFSLIGKQKVIGQTRQARRLANGLVYLRDNSEIVCLDLNK